MAELASNLQGLLKVDMFQQIPPTVLLCMPCFPPSLNPRADDFRGHTLGDQHWSCPGLKETCTCTKTCWNHIISYNCENAGNTEGNTESAWTAISILNMMAYDGYITYITTSWLNCGFWCPVFKQSHSWILKYASWYPLVIWPTDQLKLLPRLWVITG